MQRTKVYHKRGGAELVISSGGKVTVESGGEFVAAAGSTITGVAGAESFASDAEAITGAITNKALNPANLAAAATTHVAAASATVAGKVELATSAETITGTDDTRAVTPAGLAALTTSASRSGLVELATNAEALAGTDTARAITADDLKYVTGKLVLWSFAGKNLTGACTLTGAKVGDVVGSVTGIAAGTVGDQSAKFETTITVQDQIQQSDNGNLSANIYLVRLLRKS